VGDGIKVHSALRPPMAYCASPGWSWWWTNWWNDWQGKPKYSEETCRSAALSTTNPTCCPYANPGRRGGKPATNRLSYGMASLDIWIQTQSSVQISVRFLVWPLLFHVLLPLLYDMFRSHKDRRQVCMLLHVNCCTVSTLTMPTHTSKPTKKLNS
jgi:hypothetical protein